MRWRLRLACLAFALAGAWAARAEDRFLGVDKAEIRRVIELGYNLNPQVKSEIDRLKSAHPESPTPDLLEVGRLYWDQRYALIDEAKAEAFEKEAYRALEKSKKYEDEHPNSRDAAYTVAMIEMSLVRFYVDEERWWAAFWKTRSSMRTMKRLLREDPGYADAALPLGMANCYLADAPSYLKPLAFLMRFSGDMKQGLAYMEQSKADGLFTGVDASYYLAEIQHGLLGDSEAARAESAELADRFPDNLKFQLNLAELERRCGSHAQALGRMDALLARPELAEFPFIRVEAALCYCWSALGAQRWELAREASHVAERAALDHEPLRGFAGWALVARAEATKALGDVDGSIAIFQSIEPGKGGAFERAQVRVAEIRAEGRG